MENNQTIEPSIFMYHCFGCFELLCVVTGYK